MTIVEFLTARLDETQADAEAVQAVDPGPWTVQTVPPRWPYAAKAGNRSEQGPAVVVAADGTELWDIHDRDYGDDQHAMAIPTAQHVARHDPARVLREVKAKRKRLALYVEVTDILFHGGSSDRIKYQRESGRFEALDLEVRRDAALYGDHPDYEQSWSVE